MCPTAPAIYRGTAPPRHLHRRDAPRTRSLACYTFSDNRFSEMLSLIFQIQRPSESGRGKSLPPLGVDGSNAGHGGGNGRGGEIAGGRGVKRRLAELPVRPFFRRHKSVSVNKVVVPMKVPLRSLLRLYGFSRKHMAHTHTVVTRSLQTTLALHSSLNL